MRKIALILVLIAVVACNPLLRRPSTPNNAIGHSVQAQSCYTVTCATVGQNCTTFDDTELSSLVACQNSYCQLSPAGVCTALGEDGAKCDSDDQCKSQYCQAEICSNLVAIGKACNTTDQCVHAAAECYENVCVARNGESCTTNSQCWTNICTSGKCAPVPVGQRCRATGMCGDLNWCNSGTCAVPVALGAPCPNGDECGINVCVPTANDSNGKCITPYSLGAEELCYDFSACGDGLACVGEPGHCRAVTMTSSGRACNTTDDCDTNEECECNFNKGKNICIKHPNVYGNPSGTKAAWETLYKCASSKCPDLDEACATTNCGYEICIFENKQLGRATDYFNTIYVPCQRPDEPKPKDCPAPSSYAATSAAVSLVALAASIAISSML